MAIDLPALPRGTTIAPRGLRFGGDLRSVLGGPTQRMTRLGSRFAVDVDMPKMAAPCAAALIAARLRAETIGDTLRLPIPQHGNGSAAGTPTATGGAINSAVLTKSGGGAIAVGMFFSFVAGGRSYLHMATSVAGATVGVAPLLRASPVGHVLNFAAPVIEGLVDETAWTLERLRVIGQRFTITEAR